MSLRKPCSTLVLHVLYVSALKYSPADSTTTYKITKFGETINHCTGESKNICRLCACFARKSSTRFRCRVCVYAFMCMGGKYSRSQLIAHTERENKEASIRRKFDTWHYFVVVVAVVSNILIDMQEVKKALRCNLIFNYFLTLCIFRHYCEKNRLIPLHSVCWCEISCLFFQRSSRFHEIRTLASPPCNPKRHMFCHDFNIYRPYKLTWARPVAMLYSIVSECYEWTRVNKKIVLTIHSSTNNIENVTKKGVLVWRFIRFQVFFCKFFEQKDDSRRLFVLFI